LKYAKEIIDLMAAYPGREFRKREIIRYVMTTLRIPSDGREAVRKGVMRVLSEMETAGTIRHREIGFIHVYAFGVHKVGHEVANCSCKPGLEPGHYGAG